MTKPSVKRWLYVFTGMVIYMCLGTVYSWSIFRTPLEQKLGIGASVSGIPYVVFLVCFTVAMLLMGKALDKFRPRVVILFGGILLGLGWILSGLTDSFNMIILFNGVIAGSGVGIVYGAPVKFITRIFNDKKGLAIGLLIGGFGLSPFVTAPISKMLINNLGVSSTFTVIGIFFLVAIPLLGWPFKNTAPAEEYGAGRKDADGEKIGQVMKSPKFFGLWICFVLGASIGLMTIGVSSQIGVEVFGISADTTALLLSVFAVFNAVGRPVFGWITDRFSPLAATLTSFVLIIIAGALLYFPSNYTVFIYVTALSLLWMNLGAWMSIAPTSVAMFFGDRHYSRNYGVIFTAYGIGALVGTPLADLMRSRFGSYQNISVPIMIGAAVGIAVALLTMQTKRKTAPKTTVADNG